MAENTETELKEAKTLLQRMTAFLSGQSVELNEEEKAEEEMMATALEVGEYTLPDGRKLVVSEEGAEIEAPAEEAEEPEMKKEEEEEKTEMSVQEPTEEKAEEVELSAEKVEQVVELAEKQAAEIAELKVKLEEATKAEPLTGAPSRTHLSAEPKQINHLTQNAWQQAEIRLQNMRAKNN